MIHDTGKKMVEVKKPEQEFRSQKPGVRMKRLKSKLLERHIPKQFWILATDS